MKTKERIEIPAMRGLLLVALILATLVFATVVSAQDESIQRGIDADAARYAALGRYYAGQPMAGVSQDGILAANPELMAARRYGSTDGLTAGIAVLAANPELMAARRFSSTAALAASDARLTANPELSSVTRYESCGC